MKLNLFNVKISNKYEQLKLLNVVDRKLPMLFGDFYCILVRLNNIEPNVTPKIYVDFARKLRMISNINGVVGLTRIQLKFYDSH